MLQKNQDDQPPQTPQQPQQPQQQQPSQQQQRQGRKRNKHSQQGSSPAVSTTLQVHSNVIFVTPNEVWKVMETKYEEGQEKGREAIANELFKDRYFMQNEVLVCCIIFLHSKPTGSEGENRKRDTGRARRETEDNVESTLMKKKKKKKISAISLLKLRVSLFMPRKRRERQFTVTRKSFLFFSFCHFAIIS